MGQPKALLPWRGTTLLDWCLREARAAGVGDLVVVLGPSFAVIEPSLDVAALKRAYNLDVATGRSNSIRLGAAQVDDAATAVVVQSVDQPCPARVLVSLLATMER